MCANILLLDEFVVFSPAILSILYQPSPFWAQKRGPFPKHLLCHWNDTAFLCRERYEKEMLIYHFSMKLYLNLSCQSHPLFFMNSDTISVALIFCFCFGFLTSLYISKHIMSYLLTHCRLNDRVKYVPHSLSPPFHKVCQPYD